MSDWRELNEWQELAVRVRLGPERPHQPLRRLHRIRRWLHVRTGWRWLFDMRDYLTEYQYLMSATRTAKWLMRERCTTAFFDP